MYLFWAEMSLCNSDLIRVKLLLLLSKGYTMKICQMDVDSFLMKQIDNWWSVTQVVCKDARKEAGSSFLKMVNDDEDFQPRLDSRVCNQEACQVGRL